MTKRNDFKTIGDLHNFGNRKLKNIKREQQSLLICWLNETDSKLLTVKDISIYTIELAINTIDQIIDERQQEAQFRL
jgi:hypothetical protein